MDDAKQVTTENGYEIDDKTDRNYTNNLLKHEFRFNLIRTEQRITN